MSALIKLDGNPFELKLLTASVNWLRIGSMLASELGGYFSPLPKGSIVSVNQGHPGRMAMQAPELIASGAYHVAISSPGWMMKLALEGRGSRGWGEKPLPLRALAMLPHDDLVALCVRKDLNISRIAQLREQKTPLRMSTAPLHLNHPFGWLLDVLLEEYGMAVEDFERWGGVVTSGDRQPHFMEKVPEGAIDRVSAMQSGALNAVFDEAIMTKGWAAIADSVDTTFLPIDEVVLSRLSERYGAPRRVIQAGRFRGIDVDVPTIDFSGWCLFCREDFPDELASLMVRTLDRQKEQIESLFRPAQGLTDKIDMRVCWQNTGLPLHPAAERYYRERGYMP